MAIEGGGSHRAGAPARYRPRGAPDSLAIGATLRQAFARPEMPGRRAAVDDHMGRSDSTRSRAAIARIPKWRDEEAPAESPEDGSDAVRNGLSASGRGDRAGIVGQQIPRADRRSRVVPTPGRQRSPRHIRTMVSSAAAAHMTNGLFVGQSAPAHKARGLFGVGVDGGQLTDGRIEDVPPAHHYPNRTNRTGGHSPQRPSPGRPGPRRRSPRNPAERTGNPVTPAGVSCPATVPCQDYFLRVARLRAGLASTGSAAATWSASKPAMISLERRPRSATS